MEIIFYIVASVLQTISFVTGLTYNEVNIIAYYFLIPFSWLVLVDAIFKIHYLKIGFAVFCVGFVIWCSNFLEFSNNLFDKSVVFLEYFDKYGLNYIEASVWICVTIPAIIYSMLILILIYKSDNRKRNLLIFFAVVLAITLCVVILQVFADNIIQTARTMAGEYLKKNIK
jgi:hypothetical protein